MVETPNPLTYADTVLIALPPRRRKRLALIWRLGVWVVSIELVLCIYLFATT